ncbi:iron-containing alcohol dehydrogenase [uncultured Cohaesibacter sp.]|uniref:iron-containing alcohol dehydrogenase n=1 Tax=uncultured Cohaesibacter sp. TaxID=1002546 RepID=UPI00292F5850|nr:iron-containing alcohol dehydrogenase [uncultured Cohaesibacter sp.]
MRSQLTPFQFMTATAIHFGRGEATRHLDEIAALGSRLLIVHGRDEGRARWLLEALETRGIYKETYAIPTEPDIVMIGKGVTKARQAGIDAVIAIGGGAVIDAGKALSALVAARGEALDYLEIVGKGLPLDQDPLPFAALPTTAGTGAEVTKNAVLTVPQARRKVSLRDPRMLPRLAIVDPALTDHLPKAITLASGLDAITQVIEPYLSCKSNPLTDALCRSAIPQGLTALVSLMEGESEAARDALAYTSLCGGLALANAGLGAVHGFAGVIGGETGAAHGALCGALLPHVLKANEQALCQNQPSGALLQRFSEVRSWIAEALGVSQKQSLDHLANWARGNGLPTLSELGLPSDMISEVVEASKRSSSMKGNPVILSHEALKSILEAAS